MSSAFCSGNLDQSKILLSGKGSTLIMFNILKVALQIFGQKFYKNTTELSLYPKLFEFHSKNPGSRKTSDNKRN